jgi:signal transduction histidine kinase
MSDPLDSSRRRANRKDESSGRSVEFSKNRPRLVDRRRTDSRALFLADISRTLSESLDYEQTLQTVARLAMPELEAWSIVDLLGPGGEIKRLSVSHPNPAFQQLAVELQTRFPVQPHDLLGAPRILGTQQPELVREVDAAMVEAAAHDMRHLGILRTLGLCSFMVVPLKARGRLLGAITFAGADPDIRYTPKDLLFAEDLAGRVAMAMDNARLYHDAQQAREEAMAAVARAAIADRAKTDFLATMSHELRTPLNAIAGYAELLELGMRGPITEQQREAIARIRRSEQHLLGIVNDILMFARTETGRIPVQLEHTPLTPAIEAVHFLVEPMLVANDIRFTREECGEQLAVLADKDRLNQILVNLISNAAKFSHRGGVVLISCHVREHLVAIEVTDEGRGIEHDKLEAIFEPFVQLSSGLTRTAEGSGLGLAISRELARLMGGDVTVESIPGKGSTFTLTLPLSTAPPPPVL